jgi:hypothetical protein
MTTLQIESTNSYDFQSYILYQIANAPIRDYPWTHIIFDKIFHDTYYDLLLKNLPEEEYLIDITKVKFHNTGYSPNRFILNDYDSLSINQKLFWKQTSEMFTDGKLKSVILNKFKKQIYDRIGSEFIDRVQFYDTFQLTKDKKGFELEPHCDAFDKIFTIVINLPKNNDNISMRTTIYNKKFDIIYQSEYKTNSGFGVFRSEDSWHDLEETCEDRWTIQYTIWGKDKV